MKQFLEYRKQYPTFIYENYKITEEENQYVITYFFSIPSLAEFQPTLTIPKEVVQNPNVDFEVVNYLCFQIGMIEIMSYLKCTCSPTIIVKSGYLDQTQIDFFKKLYYNGLGEFFYVNGIECDIDAFDIICEAPIEVMKKIPYTGVGNLIPIGGGKDSYVTLEILKNTDFSCFILNPKEEMIKGAKQGGNAFVATAYRTIDPTLLRLNQEGFLNGHTPFSSLMAFVSYLIAYLQNKKYIVLSNEASANQATVLATGANHQYSKSFEFEQDFDQYAKKYLPISIQYFSFLRPLTEFQIAMLFACNKTYHSIFKSCNVGSKHVPWVWCCDCPKCLFVYIMLSPFLSKEELIHIYGEDLYEKESLLDTFIALCGYAETKPFECVGTIEEVRYAVSLVIKQSQERKLPYLLQYYQDHYPLALEERYETYWNPEHHLNTEFETLLKEACQNVI